MTREARPLITRINPAELGTPPGYSQIVDVSASRIIFIAGQTALDRDGRLVGEDDFAVGIAGAHVGTVEIKRKARAGRDLEKLFVGRRIARAVGRVGARPPRDR